MPLLLLDLDNTLVDRDTAFGDAVAGFLSAHGLPGRDLAWVMAVDAGGYTARHDVAAAMANRYGGAVPAAAIRTLLDNGGADRVRLARATRVALQRAEAAGWTHVIVTNGRTAQQEAKIRRCGLDQLVKGWAVSESVGHKKPDPRIFHAAAAAVGAPLTDAWVVGDSPHADMAGAHTLGLRSVWVANGRTWTEKGFRPTHVADDAAAAIDHAVEAAG